MQVIDLLNRVDGPNGAAGLPPPDSRLSLPLQKARGGVAAGGWWSAGND